MVQSVQGLQELEMSSLSARGRSAMAFYSIASLVCGVTTKIIDLCFWVGMILALFSSWPVFGWGILNFVFCRQLLGLFLMPYYKFPVAGCRRSLINLYPYLVATVWCTSVTFGFLQIEKGSPDLVKVILSLLVGVGSAVTPWEALACERNDYAATFAPIFISLACFGIGLASLCFKMTALETSAVFTAIALCGWIAQGYVDDDEDKINRSEICNRNRGQDDSREI